MAIGGVPTPGSPAGAAGTPALRLFPQSDGYVLPQGTTLTLAYVDGNDLVLVQPDGSLIVLVGAVELPAATTLAGFSVTLGDVLAAAYPSRAAYLEDAPTVAAGDEAQTSAWLFPVTNDDELIGLQISPLLDPPQLDFAVDDDDFLLGSGDAPLPTLPPSEIGATVLPAVYDETDGPVEILLTEFLDIYPVNPSSGETLESVTVTLSGLPPGTTANGGAFSGGSFTFTGAAAAFETLVITLPADYANEGEGDGATPAISGTLSATSNYGVSTPYPFTIVVNAEADIDILGPGSLALTETDGPVLFRPSDAALPQATDADGSESITEVTLELAGLPPGTVITVNGVTAPAEGDGSFSFTGSLASYQSIAVTLPADFSTESPATTISGEVSATTDEGGADVLPLSVTIAARPDIDLATPTITTAETDAALSVTPSESWTVTVSDADGSETLETVTLTLENMPPGMTFAGSGSITYDAGSGGSLVFTGTPADYVSLQLIFPADFSTANPPTSITGTLAATSNEGSTPPAAVELVIVFEPDVAVDAPAVVVAEEDGSGDGTVVSLGINVTIDDDDGSENDATVVIEFSTLPPSTTASTGSLDAGALTWSGTPAEAEALELTFPSDLSGELATTITVTTAEGSASTSQILVGLPTPDIDFTITPIAETETDAPLSITPSASWIISISDLDGSETLETVTLTLANLPPGMVFNGVDPGTITYDDDAGGGFTFTGTSAEYDLLELVFPTDFSTANPPTSITGTLAATSNEGAGGPEPVTLSIAFEADVAVTAPTALGAEDQDGSGATVALGINVTITDADGSEDDATAEIVFTGLPNGTAASVGALVGDTWSGTATEAEALSLIFPQDFAGAVTSEITVTTPEGEATTSQTITVTATADIDFDIAPIAETETDAPLVITPSTSWAVSISDADASEALETVTLTLQNLPSGMTFAGVDPSTVTYDPVLGGSFSFTGAPSDYAALQLVFPTDFSTANPPTSITGTLVAASDEGAAGPEPVEIAIAFEADVAVAAPTVLGAEDQDGSGVTLALNIDVTITDADGSEDAATAEIVFTGLPAGVTASVGALAGDTWSGTAAEAEALALTFPQDFSGEVTSEITVTTPEGAATTSQTLTISPTPDIDLAATTIAETETDAPLAIMPSGSWTVAVSDGDGSEAITEVVLTLQGLPPGMSFSGVDAATLDYDAGAGTLTFTGSEADYTNLQLIFPADFSTVNPPTAITGSLAATSNEGSAAPIPVDLTIGFEADVAVEAPALITAQEDQSGTGAIVSLEIDVQITDADGSEDAATVEIVFSNLPDGTTVSTGVLNGLTWTGSAAEAEALEITFPENISGQTTTTITVTTPEGSATTNQLLIGLPSPDIEFTTPPIAEVETDAAVSIAPGDSWTVAVTDPSETLETIVLTLDNLPAGVTFSGVDPATITYDAAAGGTFNFTGTPAEYAALVIDFPADFSSQSRADGPQGDISGTLSAASNEGAAGPLPVSLSIAAEGDIAMQGPGSLVLGENDPAGSPDEDATTEAPLQFRPVDAVLPSPTDADGSESIAEVDVEVTGLPDGTLVSTGSGFTAVAGGTYTATALTFAEYQALTFQLPADYSTASPASSIVGTVTARSDEAILAGESDLGAEDGVATAGFTVAVDSEADIQITAADVEVEEDSGPFALDLDAAAVDADGSETLDDSLVTVNFANLPAGGINLSDGTVIDAGNTTWSGTLAELRALGVQALPEHYSGIIDATVTAASDEGDPAGTSRSFQIRVLPVAEVTVSLTAIGDAVDGETVVVKEGGGDVPQLPGQPAGFVVHIEAATADTDGSEQLTTITIENVPAAWIALQGGTAVDPAAFTLGGADVAGAVFTPAGAEHGTLVITLNGGLTAWSGEITLHPPENEDRDVATIAGGGLSAVAASSDAAAGLPTDSADSAADTVDVDLDAVADAASVAVSNRSDAENTGGLRQVLIGIDSVALNDADGSEFYQVVTVTLDLVTTETTGFDASDPAQLSLTARPEDLSDALDIVFVSGDAGSATFQVTPQAGVSAARFEAALAQLRIEVPEGFSGQFQASGVVQNAETLTGDGEFEPGAAENVAETAFGPSTVTVVPVAEASLIASAFVVDLSDLADGSPAAVGASADGSEVAAPDTLTLLENTDDDGDGQGNRSLFISVVGATADTDGSEQLQTLVIHNIPSAWISAPGGNLDLSTLFSEADPTQPLEAEQLAKIANAVYDEATGQLTITFGDDVISFAALLRLEPSLYEDYDVDRTDGDPFTAQGSFFGEDLRVELTTLDDNGITTATQTAAVALDVDVDPLNNPTLTVVSEPGVEGEIDPAGGVYGFSLTPQLPDMDGSETIDSILMRNVPDTIQVWVTSDPFGADPSASMQLALLAETDPGNGVNGWTLEQDQWAYVELRGIPLHYAGNFGGIFVEVVTTEADGSTGRTTDNDFVLEVLPTIDGGDPSESAATLEEVAVHVPIDGNLIDNVTNSPGSPEVVVGEVLLTGIAADAFGRVPSFFIGDPTGAPGTFTELPVVGGEVTIPSAADALNLYVLPATDSNEDISFGVQLTIAESLDPGENTVVTGTITVAVKGVADQPTAEAQDPAPDAATLAELTPIYGADNAALAFGYAGLDDAPFAFDQRFTAAALSSGVFDDGSFVDATPFAGERTETNPGGPDFDGSETIYYIISGLPAPAAGAPPPPSILLGLQSDGVVIVTPEQLDQILFNPVPVSEVTFYDLKFSTVVIENDEVIDFDPTGDIDAKLAELDALDGAAVTSVNFSVVVAPSGNAEPVVCDPEDHFGPPALSFVGSGVEDQDGGIPLQLQLTPGGGYSSLQDLLDLPGDVQGYVTVSITNLPPGASLSSDVPGAVLYDPINDAYVIDLTQLLDPADTTLSTGALLYFPPEHQSSPDGFADPDGPNPPYDGLNAIEITTVVLNFTCGDTGIEAVAAPIVITPVADGPTIAFAGATSGLEDGFITFSLDIGAIDPGERVVDAIELRISGGGVLVDTEGAPIVPNGTDGSDNIYNLSASLTDLANLRLAAPANYGGNISVTVTAATEDVDFSTADGSAAQSFYFDPVADTAVVELDTTTTDPETGQPYVTGDVAARVLTIVEDQPFIVGDAVSIFSPDMDGSEVTTFTIGGIVDGLVVSIAPGGPAGGLVNNGGGFYTISKEAVPFVQIALTPEHARTNDALDPGVPQQFPITIAFNTFELANNDSQDTNFQFSLEVRPDADVPVLSAELTPTTGMEDAATPFTLDLSAYTVDPHEAIAAFVLTDIPAGGRILLGGVEIAANPDGTVSITDVVEITSTDPDAALTFAPNGVVTFVPPENFAGAVSLSVVARATDAENAPGGYVDVQDSDPVVLNLDIAVSPDVSVSAVDANLSETDTTLDLLLSDLVTAANTDSDGSEIEMLTIELTGLPLGTEIALDGSNFSPAADGTVFSGTIAELAGVTLRFAADASTPTPIAGTAQITSNEGGNDTATFAIEIAATPDVILSVTPADTAEDGEATEVPILIDVTIDDSQPVTQEELQAVVIAFDAPLAAGFGVNAGIIAGDRQSVTLSLSDFGSQAALIAAAAAFALVTAPDFAFAGTLTGTVTATSNQGSAAPATFSVAVNDQPDIAGAVVLNRAGLETFTLSAAELTGQASDPSGQALLALDPVESQDGVFVTDNGDGTFDVAIDPGTSGTLALTYQIQDDGAPTAIASATAQIQIAAPLLLQMQPDPGDPAILGDVTGTPASYEFALGSAAADSVDYDAVDRPYADVEGFRLLDGDDVVDLSGATQGYTVELGAGADTVTGSDGGDLLRGGSGADVLTGSGGDDFFAIDSVDAVDEITDFGNGNDAIDLTWLVTLASGEVVGDRVDYDSATGSLSVVENGGGGFVQAAIVTADGGSVPASVTVLFQDEGGAEQSAVIA